jgi:hypothetical protein
MPVMFDYGTLLRRFKKKVLYDLSDRNSFSSQQTKIISSIYGKVTASAPRGNESLVPFPFSIIFD